MIAPRKFRAGVGLACVSAAFWGVAGALVASSTRALGPHQPLGATAGLVLRFFIGGAVIGFVCGGLFAAGIAVLPPTGEKRGLGRGRVAFAGGVGGLIVFAIMHVALLPWLSLGSAMACVALGASMGLGILGSANRVRLPGAAGSAAQVSRSAP